VARDRYIKALDSTMLVAMKWMQTTFGCHNSLCTNWAPN